MANEASVKAEEELKEEVHDEKLIQTQEHRQILNAESATEAKQLLLIHQVETAQLI